MASQLPMRVSRILFAAALIASPAYAQGRGGGGMHGGPPQGGGGRGSYTIRVGRPAGRSGFRSRGGFGYIVAPYWWPDEGYQQPPSPPPQPPAAQEVVEKQAAPATPPTPPAESLMLEYKNGQWVRVPTGEQMPPGPLTVQPESPGPAKTPAARAGRAEKVPPPPPPNPVVVFRDGRQETLQHYMIEGGFLYVRQNYWVTGSWTKKIPLSEVNLPATVQANKQRGAKFELPTGPDDIVVGI